MLTARLKINSGQILDITSQYGLVYLDSSKRFGPDSKGFEAVSYPEEEGEYIIPKDVDAPFDYKVKFFIQGDSLSTVNAKVAAFNSALYTKSGDVKTYKKVTFYNDAKRQIIVGYPKELAEATDFWKDPSGEVNDIAIFEWTIRVTKPSLCNFNNTNI